MQKDSRLCKFTAMIRFISNGNLLEASAEALVNAVNTVGVMGKGIALMFSKAFPENTKAYAAACRAGEVRVGHMFVTQQDTPNGSRWIINFPTKKHWRGRSQLEWITEGLKDLVRVVRTRGIRSVAVPALGCGLGGLKWDVVRPAMESALGELDDVDVLIYEPS